jgi:hypothetical protein
MNVRKCSFAAVQQLVVFGGKETLKHDCTAGFTRQNGLASRRFSRHTFSMSEEPLASDLEKAHLILGEFGLLIGPAGAMSDVIARAVAAGIALGRKEALAEARRDDQQASKD